MTIDFNYIAEDFKEAAAARIAALREKGEGVESPKTETRRLRGMLGVTMFLFLAVGIFAVIKSEEISSSTIQYKPRSEPVLTHNYLQTLVVASIAPLCVMAFFGWMMAKGFVPSPVPFYTAKWPGNHSRQLFWRIATGVSLLIALGAVIAVFNRPTEPNWRPTLGGLIFTTIGPWWGWLSLLGIYARVERARAKKRQGSEIFYVEGSSRVQPQHVDIDATGVTQSTALESCRYNWIYYVSYVESENLLTLYTRDLTMQLIPKRAFIEPGSFERFCGLVQTHIPAGLFRPRQSAFGVVTPVPAFPIDNGASA